MRFDHGLWATQLTGDHLADFINDCPGGQLSKEQFQQIFRDFFPFGDAAPYADFVFRIFDSDKSGLVDFKEFVSALSISSRGELEEKLDWAFRLYDINDDGKISYDEMLAIVEAIYKMVSEYLKNGLGTLGDHIAELESDAGILGRFDDPIAGGRGYARQTSTQDLCGDGQGRERLVRQGGIQGGREE